MKQEKMQKFIKNPPNDPPYDLIIVEVNIFKIKSNESEFPSTLSLSAKQNV